MDTSKAINIGGDVYWLGNRSESLLETNTYLIAHEKDGRHVNIIVDPGPSETINALQKAAQPIIGGLNKTHIMLINHQDPDVSLNSNYIQKLNPNCLVVASEDTWRLIRFYDLKVSKFRAVETFRSGRVKFSSGHQMVFVPTPFCHFRGAIMFYDVSSRILFSGDFMGGLSYSQDLYATEDSWEGIKTFHQLYMPSHEAVKLAISRIRNLNPKPLKIAPQHGSIIEGLLVDDFLERMYHLPVGLDLFKDREKVENYIGAANEILSELLKEMDESLVMGKLERFNEDGSFTNILNLKNNRVMEIKGDPHAGMKIFIDKIREGTTPEEDTTISLIVVKTLVGRNIPIGDLVPAREKEENLPDYFE